MTLSQLLKSCVVALLLVSGSATLAHQQKSAFTKVLFNPRTQNIEVMHRFYIHDAEHAVKEIFGKKADILNSNETQRLFSSYVSDGFSMANAKGENLLLEAVGFEVDGKFFWVYQQTAQPTELQGLTFKHGALRDIWPEQVNTINIEGKGKLQTLTFENKVELLNVAFN